MWGDLPGGGGGGGRGREGHSWGPGGLHVRRGNFIWSAF